MLFNFQTLLLFAKWQVEMHVDVYPFETQSPINAANTIMTVVAASL